LFDEGKKIAGCEAGESGSSEIGIGGVEILGCGVNVGEIAAATAGDEDFLADAVGVFDDGDATSAFASFESTEEARGTSAENQHIEGTSQSGLTVSGCEPPKF